MITRLIVPVLLQLLGVAIIIAEFILPSGGALTVMALAVFGYSLYMVFSGVSVTVGLIFVAVDLLMIPILVLLGIKILANSPASLKTALDKGDGAQMPEELLGLEGVTISDLRPAGVALIAGRRRDVVSKGDYIPKDTSILVTATEGNRIVVKINKAI